MTEIIICAMDKRKTSEELLANYKAADYTADYTAAYSADYSAAASYAAAAAYAAAYSAANDLEYWLTEYFDLTGEDREAYQKEADK